METDLLIVGGGPAGMVAGLLFARAGVRTLVIEKHADFLRDFRGDTVHPSTLDVFEEIGLLKGLLRRPHSKIHTIGAVVGRRSYRVANFGRLPGAAKFVAMMPQWEFLDFVAAEARRYPAFSLRMETEATGILRDGQRVVGVETRTGEIRARLVIAADGRGSILRDAVKLPKLDLGAPIDVFWFRIPKAESRDNRTQAYLGAGEMLVTIDRGDYFQCARVIAKGQAERYRQLGLQRFRMDIAKTAPALAGWLDSIDDWDEIKLLGVSLDRLKRWWRPGFLAIGDAAHAMSPVGGVGINLAIQDAVAAANVLAAPLAAGEDVDGLLKRIEERRLKPIAKIQALQKTIHDRVIGHALRSDRPSAPFGLKLIDRFGFLQKRTARILGLGIQREHVTSPDAGQRRDG